MPGLDSISVLVEATIRLGVFLPARSKRLPSWPHTLRRPRVKVSAPTAVFAFAMFQLKKYTSTMNKCSLEDCPVKCPVTEMNSHSHAKDLPLALKSDDW